MKIKIKKMPDRRTLEIFLEGMGNEGLLNKSKVIFNVKKGEFERIKK